MSEGRQFFAFSNRASNRDKNRSGRLFSGAIVQLRGPLGLLTLERELIPSFRHFEQLDPVFLVLRASRKRAALGRERSVFGRCFHGPVL